MGRDIPNQPTAQVFQFRIDRVHARVDADEQVVIGFIHALIGPRSIRDPVINCVNVISNATHITRHRARRTVILLSELVFWLVCEAQTVYTSWHESIGAGDCARRPHSHLRPFLDRVGPTHAPSFAESMPRVSRGSGDSLHSVALVGTMGPTNPSVNRLSPRF